MRRSLLLIVSLLSLGAAGAAPPENPPPVAIRAGRLLDVKRGVFVANPVVVVEAGRIREVRKDVPVGADVLDLGGATLLPGLFDMHTHVTIGGNVHLRGPDAMTVSPEDTTIHAVQNARVEAARRLDEHSRAAPTISSTSR